LYIDLGKDSIMPTQVKQQEVYRRIAVWLHRRGLEVTPTEISVDLPYAFDAIRQILRTENKLVPKSDHDMIRFIESFQVVKQK
jgi:hypothetical protein